MSDFSEVVTPDRPQYIVYFDHADSPEVFSVRLFDGSNMGGRQIAAHRNIEAVRQVIPLTHVETPYIQKAPIVEVWVRRELAEKPRPKRAVERYPRGWHPDDEGHG